MTRFVTILFLLLSSTFLHAKPLKFHVEAESMILMNAETGAILAEKNSHRLQYPASTTKVATAAYALKKKGSDLDVVITAEQDSIASVTEEAIIRSNYTLPSHWVEQKTCHMGIKKGEELKLRDLLYGLMLPSANDAANVIAQHVGGTIPQFVVELNAFLKEIGCKNTVFYNPHGLHHPKHQTTAYDLAILTREALKDPMFAKIVSTVRYKRPKTNKQEATTMVQNNRLLKIGRYHYPKAIGVKTGYTSIAQCNIVAAARHEDRTLIAVLLKTKDRNDMFTNVKDLFEAAFNEPKVQRILLKAGPQKYTLNLEGASEPLRSYLKQDLAIEYYPAEEPQVRCLLYWDKISPPVMKDQRIGELRLLTSQEKVVQTLPLYAQNEATVTWWHWLKSKF
jgi:serine-type D-Ala-D-Ala carboxypeptidase (penicillin-binding protein 5/6)